jgi:hypothetical protein
VGHACQELACSHPHFFVEVVQVLFHGYRDGIHQQDDPKKKANIEDGFKQDLFEKALVFKQLPENENLPESDNKPNCCHRKCHDEIDLQVHPDGRTRIVLEIARRCNLDNKEDLAGNQPDDPERDQL